MKAGIAFGKTADALRYGSGANRAAIDRACRSGPDCPPSRLTYLQPIAVVQRRESYIQFTPFC
jgi:hypothetical protein